MCMPPSNSTHNRATVTTCSTKLSDGACRPGTTCTMTAAATSNSTAAGTFTRAVSRLDNTATSPTTAVTSTSDANGWVSDMTARLRKSAYDNDCRPDFPAHRPQPNTIFIDVLLAQLTYLRIVHRAIPSTGLGAYTAYTSIDGRHSGHRRHLGHDAGRGHQDRSGLDGRCRLHQHLRSGHGQRTPVADRPEAHSRGSFGVSGRSCRSNVRNNP